MSIMRFVVSFALTASLRGQDNMNLGEILISIPNEVRVEKSITGESVTFKLFDLSKQQLLLIHINKDGVDIRNAVPRNTRPIVRSISGVEYSDVIWVHSRLSNRNTILRRLSKDPFPAVITAMYRNLNDKQSKIADQILSSISLNEAYFSKFDKK